MRGEVGLSDPREDPVEEELVEGRQFAVRDRHLHEAEELGEEAGENERQERVRPEREERGKRTLDAEKVDHDEGGEQREAGRA